MIVTGDTDPWVKPNLPPIKSDKKKEASKSNKDPGTKDVENGGAIDTCEEERESLASKMIKSVFCLM